jgi:epoxyqueuosine reductase
MMDSHIAGLSQQIKDYALETGFDACGISTVEPATVDRHRLDEWINRGFNGQMTYMERNAEKRENPELLVEDARSVISVLLNYYPPVLQPEEQFYKISKYAYGKDYHYVVKEKLRKIMRFIDVETSGKAKMRGFTDSAPVFDKSWAVKAGLGWIGKNSLLINKKLGSFVFVGEIITDLNLVADTPLNSEYCGSCTACIEACPTGAITEPYTVDARLCISYHTIETKEPPPPAIAQKSGGRIFGCDICQDVCPWNSKLKPHNTPEFKLSDSLVKMKKRDWEELDKPAFKRLFKGTPLERTGFAALKENIRSVLS